MEETPNQASAAWSAGQTPPPPKVSLGRRMLYYLWDADQHLKTPQERALVRKLDFNILICTTLVWWILYIDQSNLSNAYVTGMKEDLDIQGNEYTIMQICYNISFAVMQIPFNMLALKIRPRYCLAITSVGWTVFTFAQAGARSSGDMYAFRFMVGFFEAAFSPIIIFLLGMWYTKAELAKRLAIWHITGFFGQATSGFMQAGIQASLDGRLGMAGWRWLYIICGCMSAPVGLAVWFFLPDFPHNTTAWYLTEEDKKLVMERGARAGKAEITGKMDLKLLRRMLGSWRWWTLCVMYVFYGNSCQANNYFAIYLASAGYSNTLRNVIPACAHVLTMVTDFTWGFMSDLTGSRAYWLIGPLMGTTVVGSSILTAWPAADMPKVVGFFFVSGGYTTAVAWTWANEINNGNAEERALTIASMNALFYVTNSFLPLLLFPQTTAPKFPRGFPAVLAFTLISVILVFFTNLLHKRQKRQDAAARASTFPAEVSDQSVAEVDLDQKTAYVAPVRSVGPDM